MGALLQGLPPAGGALASLLAPGLPTFCSQYFKVLVLELLLLIVLSWGETPSVPLLSAPYGLRERNIFANNEKTNT